jgi:hypothetical protein
MENHFILNDSEFEKAFKNCSLDPTLFSHEAHLRLAWIHINNYGVDNAQENIQEQLQKFVQFVGATDKYHKTLTIAAVRAVNHFIKQSNTYNFKGFIDEFPQLKTDFKTLINSHYSIDVFNSEFAKIRFLEPDLAPFN